MVRRHPCLLSLFVVCSDLRPPGLGAERRPGRDETDGEIGRGQVPAPLPLRLPERREDPAAGHGAVGAGDLCPARGLPPGRARRQGADVIRGAVMNIRSEILGAFKCVKARVSDP